MCFSACEAIAGLDEFSITPASDAGVSGRSCVSHRDCGELEAQWRCVPAQNRCAALRTEECSAIAGPDGDDRSIWIGSVFSTSGVHASANLARQQSAVLAVEQINASGGISFDPNGNDAHPLVLVACDGSRDPLRAAKFLVQDLGIRAVIGPDDSQDAQSIATKVAIPNDALLVSPVSSQASLPDLLDDDLSWLMVTSDVLRAPWLTHQLRALESATRKLRPSADLKLGVVVRDDAQGQSMRAAVSSLTFDDKPLSDPANLGTRVRIDTYAPDRTDTLGALADAYLKFAPDIVVLLGLSEVITRFVTPLEERWNAAHPMKPPPEYFLTDGTKVPELVELAARRDELRARLRGLGAGPPPEADPAYASFVTAYQRRFSSELTAVSGLAATYDATFAVSLAIAKLRAVPTSGQALAAALREVTGGTSPADSRPEQLRSALDAARAGTGLSVTGALAPLRWDVRGAPIAGALEVWCLERAEGRTNFASSGFRVNANVRPSPMAFGACAREGVQTSGVPSPPVTARDPENSGLPDPTPEPPDTNNAPNDAGMDASAPPLDPPANVPCGATACDVRANEYCCVTAVRGAAEDPRPEDFRCASVEDKCAIALRCTSDTDCSSETVCCGTGSATECVPEAACTARAGTRLSCEASSQCGADQTCCAHLMPGITGYANIACAAECNVAAGGLVLCESDLDCVNARVLGTCRPSRIVPNLKVCVLF